MNVVARSSIASAPAAAVPRLLAARLTVSRSGRRSLSYAVREIRGGAPARILGALRRAHSTASGASPVLFNGRPMAVPHPGLTLAALPITPLPVFDALSRVTPWGETEEAFNVRLSARLDGLDREDRTSLKQFTSFYGHDIRLADQYGEGELYAREGWDGTRSRIMRDHGDRIARAFRRVRPEPGVAYRGMAELEVSRIVTMIREREIALGQSGRGAATSATWDPSRVELFMDGFGNAADPDEFKIFMLLHGKTQIGIAPLSLHPTEREMLFGRHARFALTGVSRAGAPGSDADRVIVMNVEEDVD